MPSRSNRLANETSPYLQQHAHNPVEWFPWGEEALTRAREDDKPILLSIGYAACHWCHVMERESFEDEAIAKQMNEHFVCIKVDREERPDLDEIYMRATVALSGGGGWPMTVFLTPTQEPFFAGTYFPPRAAHGRPGFEDLLARVAEMWQGARQELTDQAKQLAEVVAQGAELPEPMGVTAEWIRTAARQLAGDFDASFGGFGGAPKFPAPFSLALLLRHYRQSNDEEALSMVTRTLDGMLTGGIYDQLGGGFARYSVDIQWLVPHFEKMLYDNAQLAEVYLEALQVTGDAQYRRVARETLDYLLREMQSPSGGFFSSSDADSEGAEGKYFCWTRSEIGKVLGEPATTHFCAFYGVTDAGNFEGSNVLTTRRALSVVARELGIDEAMLAESLEDSRAHLLEARSERVAPDVDDKILTAWNGMAIRALAQGARILGDGRYLTAAERAAEFVLSQLTTDDGRLLRTYRSGRAHLSAYLEDYAQLADGLISLYEAGGPSDALYHALELCDWMLSDFGDPRSGALYHTAHNHEQLLARQREAQDRALPGANAVAARVLARLARHTGRDDLRAAAEGIARAYAAQIKRLPRGFCSLLGAVELLLEEPVEIVLTGDPNHPGFVALQQAAASVFLPSRIEAQVHVGDTPDSRHPLTAGKEADAGAPRAYVCEGFACQAPVTDAEELVHLLESINERHQAERRNELGREVLLGSATAEGTATAMKLAAAKAATEPAAKPAAESAAEPAAESAAKPAAESAASEQNALTAGFASPVTLMASEPLSVHPIALGTYRVGLDVHEHHQAVRAAFEHGVNLVDTSPAFALGDSERLVGEVLAELALEGRLSRDGVVVISKVGVLVGAAADALATRLGEAEGSTVAEALAGTNTVPLAPGGKLAEGAFCLEASSLREQLSGSLERLGLERLDFCVVQSPEHLLLAGHTREEYRAALTAAFEVLEAEVAAGRISAYGVLSNTLTRGKDDVARVDVDELVELACTAGGDDHHLRLLQLPINLVEREALQKRGALDGRSLTTRARDLGLSVLAVRPLSALADGKLTRLVDPPASEPGAAELVLSTARYKVASLEAEFETTLATRLRLAGLASSQPILPLGGALTEAVERTGSLQQFQLAESTLLTPRLRAVLARLDQAFSGPDRPNWVAFRDKYIQAVGVWLSAVRERAVATNRELLTRLNEELKAAPEFSHWSEAIEGDTPFAQRALGALLTHPSVDAVVVGMRRPEQVAQLFGDESTSQE